MRPSENGGGRTEDRRWGCAVLAVVLMVLGVVGAVCYTAYRIAELFAPVRTY